MADKKPTTKAHRGFIHIPRRRRRRQLRRAQPIQIGPDGKPIRRPRVPRRPPLQEIRLPSLRRYNDELRVLRDFAKARGKTIPRFPTGTPSPTIRRDPQKMRAFRLRQLQNQINKTKRFLNLPQMKQQAQQIARMGSRRQTAAPAQRALANPNRRRPMTADQRQRMIRSQNTRVAKGGAVRKKK